VVAWKNGFFPSYGLPHAESDAPELLEVKDSGAARAEPSLLELCQVATESYVMKSVFTRRTLLIRTTKDVCFFCLGLVRIRGVDCAKIRYFRSYGLLHMESDAPEV